MLTLTVSPAMIDGLFTRDNELAASGAPWTT